MIKPKDFDPTKKISCFHVPIFRSRFTTSKQRVKSRHYWFMMLSQQGYIVACVDGRGTGFKGAASKSDVNAVRKYEVEDQIDAKVIGNYAFVDKSRMGIGWSYGGFMSSNCL
jgi:dipeptidyl-peptidase-4